MSFLMSLLCCSDDVKQKKLTNGKLSQPASSYRQNGIGIYTYDNGDQYDGEWMDNKRHGRGKMIYKNGDFFLGQWVMDKKGGRGLYVFSNMEKYEGEWKNDLMDGVGKITYENGSFYEGEFSQGKKDGKGIYYNSETKRKYNQQYRVGQRIHRTILKDASNSPVKHFNKNNFYDRPKITDQDIEIYIQNHPEIFQVGEAEMLYYYGICRIKGLQFFKNDPKTWTIDNVLAWSKSVGISSTCEQPLRKQKIGGKVLLDTKINQLNDYLHMPLGDKKKWTAAIQHVKKHYLVKEHSEKQKQKQKIKEKKKPNKVVNHVESNYQRRRSFTFYSGKIPNLASLNIQASNPIEEQNDDGDDQSIKNNQLDSPRKISTTHNLTYITEDLDTLQNNRREREQEYQSQNVDRDHQQQHKSGKGLMNISGEQNDIIQIEPSFTRKVTSKKPSQQVNQKENSKDNKSQSSSSSDTSSSSEEQNTKKRKKSKQIKHIEMRQLYEYLRNHHISMNFLIPENQITNMEQIGQGGYGKVYKAKWLSNPVAVKTYMKSGRLHKKGLQNFLQQVGILNDLRHPNIVLYMGMCIQINRYSLITQYLEWGSLFDLLHKKKYRFDDTKVFNIVEDIALGMVYLHAKDVLHRDLKSSNVLMDQDWNVKLCDFGLSEVHTKKKMKSTKTRVGTYQWMAPQVLRRQKYDFPADVYSFGIIIWQILTEQIPYDNMSMNQIVGTVGYDQTFKIQMPPRGQPYLIQIMYQCLRYRPEERPTFKKILELLSAYKSQNFEKQNQKQYLQDKYLHLQEEKN